MWNVAALWKTGVAHDENDAHTCSCKIPNNLFVLCEFFLLSLGKTFHLKYIWGVIHSKIVNGLENVKEKTVVFQVVRMFVICLLPITITIEESRSKSRESHSGRNILILLIKKTAWDLECRER